MILLKPIVTLKLGHFAQFLMFFLEKHVNILKLKFQKKNLYYLYMPTAIVL